MSPTKPYKAFLRRYLTRGAVAVSVGLASITSASAALDGESSASARSDRRSFAERLSTIRSTVSECVEEQEKRLAQILPPTRIPPPPVVPPPPVRPFANFDNAPPFDNFANVPFSNFGKAPLDPNK